MMSNTLNSETGSFTLEGQFLGLIWEKDRVKYVQIATPKGAPILALSRKAANDSILKLAYCQNVKLLVQSKLSPKTGRLSLKVVEVAEASCRPHPEKLRLLVCQKSGCQKKGGSGYCRRLERNLEERGLSDFIALEKTGCLGQCSQAPNTMLLPDKKRLSGLAPEEIADYLSHYAHCN